MNEDDANNIAGGVSTGLGLVNPLLGAAAAGGYSLWTGYKQRKQREALEAAGAKDVTPLALRQKLQFDANQANNGQIAGYGAALDQINTDVSSALGEGKRGAVSSSNYLNLLSRLNQNSNLAKNRLYIQGQMEKNRRGQEFSNTLEKVGGYQERGRQEFNSAVGTLREGEIQNTAGGINTLGAGLVYSTPAMQDAVNPPRYSYTGSIPQTPQSGVIQAGTTYGPSNFSGNGYIPRYPRQPRQYLTQ